MKSPIKNAALYLIDRIQITLDEVKASVEREEFPVTTGWFVDSIKLLTDLFVLLNR